MADPRFFTSMGPLNLKDIATIVGVDIPNGADPRHQFDDVSSLEIAKSNNVSFFNSKNYLDAFTRTKAGACLTTAQYATKAPSGVITLICQDPYCSYAKVAQAFYPASKLICIKKSTNNTNIDPSAKIGADVDIGPGAVIGKNVVIGARSRIDANAVIGDGCMIGQGCYIGIGASVTYCIMGDYVIVHSGAQIGQDGFGFALGPGGHLKVPQLGRVIIESDVEIGANTTIDRGGGSDTVIGMGSKIDNLVQIAHNVRLGRGCVIAAQVGIAGSTCVGNFVIMGGKAGISGHLNIGDDVKIAAKSGVIHNINAGASIAGYPSFPIKEHWRQVAILSKLAKKERS